MHFGNKQPQFGQFLDIFDDEQGHFHVVYIANICFKFEYIWYENGHLIV